MNNSEYKEVRLGAKSERIPIDWDVKKIKEIFNLHAGGDVDEEKYSENKDKKHPYPIYANSLEDDGLYGYSSHFTYEGDSVTITGRGDLGRAIYRDHKFNAIVRLIVLVPEIDISGKFISNYINGKTNFPQESTGVPQLTRPQVAETRIALPPLSEQRRIANILSTVDEQIQQTEQTIEKTIELKRGLAQDLYGENVADDQFSDRASTLPSGWSRQKIADLCTIGGGSTPSKSNADYWGGDILWASPKDFNGPLLQDTEDKITELATKESPLSTYKSGSIAIVVRSGVLRHTLPVAKITTPTTVNQDVKVLEPDDERIDPEYLFQILTMEGNRIRQRCMKTGTTVESIETSFLKKYKLRVPPVKKQRQISDILQTIDKEVRLEQEHLDGLQQLKRGLMQDLLTGTKRVDPKQA